MSQMNKQRRALLKGGLLGLSYQDRNALDFTLYGVVKILNDYMKSKKG